MLSKKSLPDEAGFFCARQINFTAYDLFVTENLKPLPIILYLQYLRFTQTRTNG